MMVGAAAVVARCQWLRGTGNSDVKQKGNDDRIECHQPTSKSLPALSLPACCDRISVCVCASSRNQKDHEAGVGDDHPIETITAQADRRCSRCSFTA